MFSGELSVLPNVFFFVCNTPPNYKSYYVRFRSNSLFTKFSDLQTLQFVHYILLPELPLFYLTRFQNKYLYFIHILTRTFLFLCISGACPQLNNLVPSRDRRLTHSRANQLLIQGYQNLHQVLL